MITKNKSQRTEIDNANEEMSDTQSDTQFDTTSEASINKSTETQNAEEPIETVDTNSKTRKN